MRGATTVASSPRQAEFHVAELMRLMGAPDAQVTRASGDGGIDVVSRYYVAQVKHVAGAVAIKDVRELNGVRGGRRPLFFTSGTYSRLSVEFANSVGMALFYYRNGFPYPANPIATAMIESGL